ncbi:MAG: hypothetical protein ACP5UH_01640 [Candidatus Micrarchaeia archaeon]
MIGKEVTGKRTATIDEVLDILEERKKSGELTYEQQLALEHTKKFAHQKQELGRVKKELAGMNMLKDDCIAKILEIMPNNVMLLKQILAGCRNTLDDDTVNKIFSVIKGKA